MMRLTETERDGRRVSLTVEGRIAGELSKLLEAECTTILDSGRTVRLDCSRVSFIDRHGVSVLRRLLDRQLTIVGCLPFMLDLVLHQNSG